MTRDLDLIRKILLQIEQDPAMNNTDYHLTKPEYFGVEDARADEVRYDLALLIEQGFVNGNADAMYVMPGVKGLSWDGHEFIADITDPGIWEKTKERIGDLPNVGIAFVWEIAKSEMRKHLGLS